MKKKHMISVLLCVSMVFATACGGGQKAEQAPAETAAAEVSEEGTAAQEADEDTAAQEAEAADADGQEHQAEAQQAEAAADATAAGQDTQAASERDAIAIYFSRIGNTEFPEGTDAVTSASLLIDDGQLKGNAQMIAEWIAEEADCETFEITVQESYPVDYDTVVDQARSEQSEGIRPALKSELANVADYDTVYLVFPNWWADLPMPVYTFLDTYDLSGKKINVFITHEGSRFSDIVNTVQELEPQAEVTEGLAIQGGSVPDSEQEIKQWMKDNM